MPGMYKYSMEIESNVKKLLLDTKELQDRMDTLEGKEYKINLNIDEKKLGNVISNLEKMLDSLGKGTGDFKQFENLSKELSSIVSEVQSLSKAFGKVDDSGAKTLLSSIQNIDKSLSELSQNILNVNKNMSNMGGNTSGAVKQVENISNAYQNAAKEAEKLADAQSKIGQKTNTSLGDSSVATSNADAEIKANSEVIASIEKKKQELASYELQLEETKYELDKMYKSSQSENNPIKDQITLQDNLGRKIDENNSKFLQGTKALNEQKKVLTLFHFSDESFDKFDNSKAGKNGAVYGSSTYLSKEPTYKWSNMGSKLSQWYANVGRIFEEGQTSFSPDEISKLIKNFGQQLDEETKQLVVKELGNAKEAIGAMNRLSASPDVMLKSIGFDAMSKESSKIFQVFDSSKIVKATDIELSGEQLKQFLDLYAKEGVPGVQSFIAKLQEVNNVIDEQATESKRAFSTEEVDNLNNHISELESSIVKTKSEISSMENSLSQNPTKDAFHSDIDTSSSVKSLENLEEEIKKIFTDANELQDILDSLHNGKYFHLSWTTDGIDETGADGRVRQLSKLLKEYGYTINNFKSDSDAFDTSGVINIIKEENNVLEQNTQKVKENTQAKEQNVNVNLNKYDKRLDSYNGKIDKYKTTINRFNDGGWTSSTYLENVQAVKNAVKEYETLLNELKGKDASLVTSDDISKLDEYEKKIKDTIATVTNMSASEKGYNFVSAQKELDKIHKLLNENSNMSAEAKAKIKSYYAEIESGNPSMSLDRIHGEIMKIYNAEVEAGRAGKSFFDTLKNSGFHQIAAQMAGMFGVYDVINIGKNAFNTVKELDYALVDLKKTTAMNSSELEQFYYDSNDVAKQMGVTTKEIIDQASSWSRLGYNSKQAATEMAKLSSQFALISPGMDTTTSQEGLVSIMKAWDIGYQDVKSQIMDDINALGNAMAEDNQDIVEGMERSAAALAAVGTSTKDSFALFSGIQEVLQNSEKSGTSLRSVALRLRSFDESTEEYSSDLANITGELADLTKTAEHAQGVSVFKDGSTTEFKSLVDYFREIADIWDEMSQKQQNDFLLKAFGRTQAQAGAALIQNFKGVEKALNVMDNAAGSSDKEMETAKQSITYKLNELKQTWVGTVQDIARRKDLALIVSGLTDISKALGFVIGKLGLVPSLIVPITAILGKGKSIQRFCPIW